MQIDRRLTIIGDIGVDLVLGPLAGWPRVGTETLMERSELRAGGSAANAVLAAGYLGRSAHLISAVGDDDFGRWLQEQFRAGGAALDVCDASTTISVGLLHDCGERTFLTTRGHLEQISYERVRTHLRPAPAGGAIVLLSGVFLTPALRTVYLQLIAEVRALGYQVALDTNWPPHDWSPALRSEVGAWLAGCHHVLLNELEVKSLADETELETAIDRVVALLTPDATLVVKVGSGGAIGLRGGRRATAAAPAVEAFDTIGAGDSFNAGYLLATLEGAGLADALDAGCRCASAIIARFPRRSTGRGELARVLAAPCEVKT